MPLTLRLLASLPLSWLHAIGAFGGRLVYALSARYRKRVAENLSVAFGAGEGPAPQSVVAEAGRAIAELPYIWGRPLSAAVADIIEVEGGALVEEARREGRGILYLTPHLGCFEIIAQYLSNRAPITVLYREPRLRWVGEWIRAGRRREQLHLAPADLSGVRGLIKALRRHEAVGMLPDQVPGKGEGEWLPFFGRPAYTMTLAARLSEVPNVVVIFAVGERLPQGQGYRLHLSAPTQPLDGDTIARAAAINRELEVLIRKLPAQYLWGYNRYKRPSGAPPPPMASAP